MKIRSIIAGVLIGIGAYAYASIANKVLGAFIFSIGLISVFALQAHLFTGKIGGLNKKNWKDLIWMLIGNLIGIALVVLIAAPKETIREVCLVITTAKLEKDLYIAFLDALMCGVIIQLAVELKSKDPVSTIICIMCFILCGFEHCIANTFYFICDGVMYWQEIIYFIIYVLGNTLGAIALKHLIERGKYENS